MGFNSAFKGLNLKRLEREFEKQL